MTNVVVEGEKRKENTMINHKRHKLLQTYTILHTYVYVLPSILYRHSYTYLCTTIETLLYRYEHRQIGAAREQAEKERQSERDRWIYD